MIVINLWFIKHSNGLFHYGLDYAEVLAARVNEIWVRDEALARLVVARLPGIPVRVLGATSLLRAALGLIRTRDALFTPSSHPIAFVRRQTVVVHDSFPFEGKSGRLKRFLFRAALFASRCSAGYINYSDGHAFLRACGLSEKRTHYLPNRIERRLPSLSGPAIIGQRIVVGVFGSDSPKKNYDALFGHAVSFSHLTEVRWRIFGHDNDYVRRLKQDYRSIAIEIVDSDTQTMAQFLGSIDISVSIATSEGFARPVALALMRGIPTMLLDTPVFREFYAGSARLFPTAAALVEAIATIDTGTRLERPELKTEAALHADFDAGIRWLEHR